MAKVWDAPSFTDTSPAGVMEPPSPAAAVMVYFWATGPSSTAISFTLSMASWPVVSSLGWT